LAQIVKLKPEFVGKYKEVHAAVWPEVLKQIKQCNIVDCTCGDPPVVRALYSYHSGCATDSIFHDPETGILFASFKYIGNDYAGDMERMRQNPKVREWWKMTDGMQESLVPGAKDSESGEPSWWKPIEEVFYNP
jgi:L-rhamnose mutarotase